MKRLVWDNRCTQHIMKPSENAINHVPLQMHERSLRRKWAGRETPCHTFPDIAEEMSINIQNIAVGLF
jgi:hypothetical protein